MPRDLIEMWALTTGAVIVHVQSWIAAGAIVSLLFRLRAAWAASASGAAGQAAADRELMITVLTDIRDKLDEINKHFDRVVIFPKRHK